jgi:putative transposase
MEPSRAVKEYKEQIKELEKKVDKYAKTVGKLTVEKDWAMGKLKSLDLSTKRRLVQADKNEKLSNARKHEIMGISRSYKYYKTKRRGKKEEIKQRIKEIAEDEFMCVYGEEKVWRQLKEEGYKVSLNTVSKYKKEMGLKAVLAVKPILTTIMSEKNKKYSYKLKDVKIGRPNKVWSADITYIKTNFGTVYLAAIIDWYSKAVLSWRISNVMDTDFVMDVLENGLKKYPTPEIFNTDQGSQYTSYIHTQTLKDNGIIISMDSKGRATDNIAIERFWRTAKVERIYLNEYNSMNELKEDIRDFISFYNYQRFHQTLNYKKPMEVYNEWLKKNNQKKQNIKILRKIA